MTLASLATTPTSRSVAIHAAPHNGLYILGMVDGRPSHASPAVDGFG
jgi:hypothetical protein